MDRLLCALIYIIAALSRFSKFFAKLGLGSYEEYTEGGKLKILLAGYNGARNTGSDVRVAAIARQLRDLFGKENISITVMTMDASTMAGYFDEDVRLLTFSSLFPLDLYRACCVHHAVILCEGSTLKSTFANALTLFMCEAAGIMAAQGKPCIAYGSEVGRMEPFLASAAKRLCRDTWFITRTRESLEALQKLGLRGHAGTDAAWYYDGAISREESVQLLRDQGWDGRKPLLGIAVINPFCWPVRASLSKWCRAIIRRDFSGQYDKWYFFSDSPERRAAYKKYIARTAAGINAFLKQEDCFPVLIGMERLDSRACLALQRQLERPGAVFLSGNTSADVMTGILRRLSMLATSRYHAAVLSMEGGCPIVAVSMDERLDGIMGEIGLDRKYLLHVGDKKLGRALERALTDAWAQRQEIRCLMEENVGRYKQELDGMGVFLKQYLQCYCAAGRGTCCRDRKKMSQA